MAQYEPKKFKSVKNTIVNAAILDFDKLNYTILFNELLEIAVPVFYIYNNYKKYYIKIKI